MDVVVHDAEFQYRSTFLPGDSWKEGNKEPSSAPVNKRLTMSGCPNDVHIETMPHVVRLVVRLAVSGITSPRRPSL
jgi:hypothetical protein